MNRFVHAFARAAPGVIGSVASVAAVVVLTVIWLAAGPIVGYESSWLTIPAAVASMLALVLVVLLQYSQNRDTRAVQLKLDEVIRAVGHARSELLQLEDLSDEELSEVEHEFERIGKEERARRQCPDGRGRDAC